MNKQKSVEEMLLLELLEEVSDYEELNITEEEFGYILQNCDTRDKEELETILNKSLIKLGYSMTIKNNFIWRKNGTEYMSYNKESNLIGYSIAFDNLETKFIEEHGKLWELLSHEYYGSPLKNIGEFIQDVKDGKLDWELKEWGLSK